MGACYGSGLVSVGVIGDCAGCCGGGGWEGEAEGEEEEGWREAHYGGGMEDTGCTWLGGMGRVIAARKRKVSGHEVVLMPRFRLGLSSAGPM